MIKITKRTLNYLYAVAKGAITLKEVEHCRRNVRIGDAFRVMVAREAGVASRELRPVIREGRVIGIYPHLVQLDNGHSVTYVQIAQYNRQRGNGRYIQ